MSSRKQTVADAEDPLYISCIIRISAGDTVWSTPARMTCFPLPACLCAQAGACPRFFYGVSAVSAVCTPEQ